MENNNPDEEIYGNDYILGEDETEFLAHDDSDESAKPQCPQCEDIIKHTAQERLYMAAEMANFKKRLQKEKDEQMRYATETVLAELLPSLDNLDLALQYGSKDEACKNTVMGVEMTRKLLLGAIKKHGLEPIGTVGEEFNPEIHEAISQEAHDTIPDGHVIAVMQKGYVLKGRLLRSAKVNVCNLSVATPSAPSSSSSFDATV